MRERAAVHAFLVVGLLLCNCGAAKVERSAGESVQSSTTSKTRIHVVVHGLHSERGRLRTALFVTAEGFPEQAEKSLQWGYATMHGDEASMDFEPVAPGLYAVAVFHDENGDGKMEKDWLGRPQEGWGASRDAKGTFGPPSFADAAFETAGDTMTVHVNMRY